MKKFLMVFALISILSACNSNQQSDKKKIGYKKPVKQEQIIIKEGDVTMEKYANGQARTVRTFKKVDGKLQAVYEKIYYKDGNLIKEGAIQNGKRDGHWKSYYRNGILWSEGDFEKGVRQGITITYHPNGKKYYKGDFTDGIKSGIWKFWDENGKFIKDVTYVSKPESNKPKKTKSK